MMTSLPAKVVQPGTPTRERAAPAAPAPGLGPPHADQGFARSLPTARAGPDMVRAPGRGGEKKTQTPQAQ